MPSVQRVHIDKVLTNISVGYRNEAFIADQIFKDIMVSNISDRYYTFGMEEFRAYDTERAPASAPNEVDWNLSTDRYEVSGHALRQVIPEELMRNKDDSLAFDLEAAATERITRNLLLDKEIDAASKVMDKDNYHPDLVLELGVGGTFKWDNYTDSDPRVDIEHAKTAVHRKSGVSPNVLVISPYVLDALKYHPKLIDVIKYTQMGVLTEDLLSSLFGVKVLVGKALKSNVTNPGQTTPGAPEPLNYVWGVSAALLYVPPSPGIMTPAFGYNFVWENDGNGPIAVRKWYDFDRKATVIDVEYWYDQKVISNIAGFLFVDAVAPRV